VPASPVDTTNPPATPVVAPAESQAQLLALIADHRKKIAQLEAVVAKRKQEEAALITKFVQASAPPSQPSGPKQITSLESGPPSS
jgi:hypothetical protein